MVIFGERLRTLRTEKGLSQMDFAKQIRISKSSVNMYERGEREPSFETLEIIADYFNVDMDYLLGKSDTVKRILVDSVAKYVLTTTEQELIQNFRSLNADGKQKVFDYTADLCASGRYAETSSNAPRAKHMTQRITRGATLPLSNEPHCGSALRVAQDGSSLSNTLCKPLTGKSKK